MSFEDRNKYIIQYKIKEQKEVARKEFLDNDRKKIQEKIDKQQEEIKEKQKVKEDIAREIEKDKIKSENEANRIRIKKEQEFKKDTELKESIKKKILQNERNKQLECEATQELIDAGLIDNNHYSGKNIRESIPTSVKIAVWHRDKERCVDCNSNTNLEFDHIIPVSKGGANTTKNIQLLCRNCNRTKGSKIMFK